MQSDGVASEKAICGEALVFAYEELGTVSLIQTHTGNEVSGVTLDDIEIEGDTVGYITGRDAAGVKIYLDFQYQDNALKAVELYRGRAGGEYGLVSNVSV